MRLRKTLSGISVALVCGFSLTAYAYTGAPMLEELVDSAALPPVDQRLPSNPRVINVEGEGVEAGRHGGAIRLLMGRNKDVRLMVVYGYSRLVGYTESYDLVPDILESLENEADRIFTFHLREGHKWSDGHPFTTEDFRYYWEDIANDPDLSPLGIPQAFIVGDEPPVVEIIDATTVRYTWSSSNPNFLPGLAASRPLVVFSPAHYLKQFHGKYADLKTLDGLVSEAGQRNWASLHTNLNRSYKNNNVDLPSLQPWQNTTRPPAQRFVFERNPYYHRVDQNGLQLPYLDRVIMNVVDGKLIAAKAGAGETDLQARSLKFSDYTFLKESEERSNYQVRLWETSKGSHISLLPNLNVEDAGWRQVLRDVRFRRALSLAINREQLNQVLYYGLAVEGGNSVHELSPLFKQKYRSAWCKQDIAAANKLLDEMGLTERDSNSIRRLADGRPMVMVVETAGEDTEQVDVLELVHDDWLQIGVKLFTKPLQREVLRNRIFAGSTMMAVWGGLENGLPTANTPPVEIAPTSQQQYQWPKWGQYIETKGAAGESPDIPEAMELMRLNNAWMSAVGEETRARIWHEMLEIFTDQVFTIGLIAAVRQPVVVSTRLKNVPEKAVYNWDPGAHFGVYHPDTFWLAGGD